MLALRRAGLLFSQQSLPQSLAALQYLSTQSGSPFQITQSLGGSVYHIDVNAGGVDVHVTTRKPTLHNTAAIPGYNTALQRQLAATFLPAGYPSTVAPGYLRYVWWQTLHHCCSSANGVLASTFMLYAVGLGSGAIPTAGALNWVLKDGLGQLGTLLFGRVIAHNFDVRSRLWYLLASVKLDLAIGLEICSFLVPQHFLLLGSVSNALKGLAWMAGGSTRSSFNVTFATDNNIADITAKATSQTICTSLIGTSGGIALASYIGQSSALALPCFGVLSALHLWSGYQSARSVPLATLNPSRTWLLIERFLANASSTRRSSNIEPNDVISLPSPTEIAAVDPIFSRPSGPHIHFGTPLQQLAAKDPQGHAALWNVFRQQRYILTPSLAGRGRQGGGPHQQRVDVTLHEDARPEDCIKAMLHIALMHQESNSKHIYQAKNDNIIMRVQRHHDQHHDLDIEGLVLKVRQTLHQAEALLPDLLQQLEAAGWPASKTVLETTKHRASW